MTRKSKGKFKMKGHTLPGINQKSETANLKDGRSPSSAFQQGESVVLSDKGKEDYTYMTPSWVGDEMAMKELDRKRSRVNELGNLSSMTDEQNEEYQTLRDEVLEKDRQYNQSQEKLRERRYEMK
tara:strand:+ start:842 stop:1216 length:375 start_codon:yes stop_codon:yes gene_type:complete